MWVRAGGEEDVMRHGAVIALAALALMAAGLPAVAGSAR